MIFLELHYNYLSQTAEVNKIYTKRHKNMSFKTHVLLTAVNSNELTAARPTHAVYSLGIQQPEIPRVWLCTHSEAADRRQVMRRHYHTPTPVSTPGIDSGAYNNIMFAISMDYISHYSRNPLIRPPSESHWCGRIRGMVARGGFVYTQNALSVTRNVVV